MNLLSDQVNMNEINVIIRELRRVLDNNITGDVVEMGCYVGTTSVYLARELKNTNKLLYVYDSFEGLPDKTNNDKSAISDQFQAGELLVSKKQFIINMKKAGVPMPIIKKAWFADLKENDIPEKISFAFLDGDYYSSIVESFQAIESHLSPNAVIIVDDYSNNSLPGVSKAVDEWLTRHSATKRVEQSLAILTL